MQGILGKKNLINGHFRERKISENPTHENGFNFLEDELIVLVFWAHKMDYMTRKATHNRVLVVSSRTYVIMTLKAIPDQICVWCSLCAL